MTRKTDGRKARGGEPRRRFRVGRSGIHGRGVFATKKIRKGTRVVEYTGDIVDEEEAVRRGRRDIVLLFNLQDGCYIDGDPQTPGPCVNHSCAPNCFTEQVGQRVFIVAARAIEPGEELTYEYLLDNDERHDCFCGAANCRGTLNGKVRARKRGRRTSVRKRHGSRTQGGRREPAQR